jgi:hypothetical protein
MSKRVIALAGAFLTLALTACDGKDDSPNKNPALTQRERDSIFANSTIPGAKAVKKSMSVADSVAARQGRMSDTGEHNP